MVYHEQQHDGQQHAPLIRESPTLKELIERDRVDDDFRKGFLLQRKLAASLGIAATAGSIVATSAATLVGAIPPYFTGLAVVGGVIAATFVSDRFNDAFDIAVHYHNETKLQRQGDVSPVPFAYAGYFVSDRISSQSTVVERAYGKPVFEATSLDQVPPVQFGPAIGFIDQVVVGDVHTQQEPWMDHDGRGRSPYSNALLYHEGSFVLQRGKESRPFQYSFLGNFPGWLAGLFHSAGTPVSFLFDKAHEGAGVPFRVVKMYPAESQ